jgi:hypothetical protein
MLCQTKRKKEVNPHLADKWPNYSKHTEPVTDGSVHFTHKN